MPRSHQAVGLAIVFLFGLWGCSRAPSADSGSATAEKLKAVETKLAKLEEDFRAAASARDQLSRKLAATEGQVDRLNKDVKARDDVIQTRTAERDQVTAQFKTLRDGLKELLAKVEEGPKSDGSPTVPVIPASNLKIDPPSK
jgi:septal ring factor EnvC (AmiA/AmiB activator)